MIRMCEYLICVCATLKYMVQLLMVLVVFTDVHTLTVKYKYALHMCVVCSWRTYVNLLWGETRRWKSTCYAAVSEVMRPSQNAKIHQCIERFALGWLKVLPYLWPLDCPCVHYFSLTLSCFLSFALLACDTIALYFRFVTWSCRDCSRSIRVHSLS